MHSKRLDPLWPGTLRLPARPPRLIYLDLKHWIELSKAHSGHHDGKKHRDVLDACVKAVGDGKAVFPLTASIYAEIAKITNYRQRRGLREVIEQVSRYMVVTSLPDVAAHEIEAVLNQTVGPNPVSINVMNYLDWGVSRAFGKAGHLRIESPNGDDVTGEFRRKYRHGPEAFDAILWNAQWEFNRKAIEGPTSYDESHLRSLGWNPEAIVRAYEQKAAEELAQVRRFDNYPKWRRGRIRDAITAREVSIDVGDIFAKGFADRGLDAIDQFFDVKPDELRSTYNAMPSFDVAVTLKSSLHRDPTHRWTNNDIFDIHALALTIPYCDVVATDGSMRSHVTRHRLPERYTTVVISSLVELPNHM